MFFTQKTSGFGSATEQTKFAGQRHGTPTEYRKFQRNFENLWFPNKRSLFETISFYFSIASIKLT